MHTECTLPLEVLLEAVLEVVLEVNGTTMIRAAAGATVTGVAGIAAVISYTHIRDLALAHGQAGADATMLPLAVDGLVLASGLAMLHEARAGRGTPFLAWVSLGLGVAATLAANVGYGVAYGWVGALVSAWPAVAFVLSAELLMVMIRRGRTQDRNQDRIPVPAVSPNGHSPEVKAFGDYLERREVPGIRVIKQRLSVAQPKATRVREQIREVLSRNVSLSRL